LAKTFGFLCPFHRFRDFGLPVYVVNLFEIENLVIIIIGELGHNINKFENSKALNSWLRLAPNNKIMVGEN